ncbi:methyltransferase domain-containing protein [Mucilaginibacter sp.]|jgi:SAM-dependent methyltransferase|uniref:methyltransferase domain-containing protein n=1 Tax=Mucilaginibacter sp. TaxID=1882438 RepID=UPI002C390AA8|nr:methyltransferase domain-containing protein [Mucilaginibacter sp.]HTI57902.1 methyltransferase domain-containing protein [Mucilaginibacter sp.]
MKTILKKGKRAAEKTLIGASQVYYKLAGNKVECNICHYKANKLKSNSWHAYSSCPNCGSTVRSRLLVAALTMLDEFSENKLIVGKRVLHCAPEEATKRVLKGKPAVYKTGDYLAEGYDYGDIDYNLDITDMKQIGDKSFDCLIACDVLEHVYNLHNGLTEIYRVLDDGGYCILTVPQKDHLDKTYEDLTITDPKERERLFGQDDHMRIFGDDFVDMLAKVGFKVTAVDEKFFDKAIVDKYVLFPPVLSKHPMATNYRKVFFGKKG